MGPVELPSADVEKLLSFAASGALLVGGIVWLVLEMSSSSVDTDPKAQRRARTLRLVPVGIGGTF